jgi:ABC-type multidrug transport system permease subunit
MSRRYALGQLLLVRLRDFYREPEAIFWVYGFPLLLACGLFIAFTGKEPEPPAVDIEASGDPAWDNDLLKRLKDRKLTPEIHSAEECKLRMSIGKTALFIVRDSALPKLCHDNTRADSVLAYHWVEAILWQAKYPGTAVATGEVVSAPGDRYIDFLLPGLIGMNLMGGGLWGVGFVIVDMRVRKLLKRLLATPMHRGDFLLSIMSARLVFMLPEMTLLLLFGWLVFGVPIRCPLPTLALVVLVGAAAFAGIGLLIACRTEKTETVSGLMNLVMLPMWLLSGTFFSSERFPEVMQPLIQALPLTQLNNALREVMLQDRPLSQIAWRLGILALWGGVSFTLALRWFRWR